jgi:hypothetical protein
MIILANKIKVMETIKVYSPIEDKEIRNNLKDSAIWKQAYHADELPMARAKYREMFEYIIKFDGLMPIMVNKITKL